MHANKSLDTSIENSVNPFALNTPLKRVRGVGPLINTVATHALALEKIIKVYYGLKDCSDTEQFTNKALNLFGVGYEISDEDLSNIPTEGPAVVIANHPYGGLDGLLLMNLLLKRRKDVRLLANHMLWRIPELRDILIPIDILDPSKKQSNLRGLKTAIAHVKAGGLLATFPAGAVSHLHLRNGHVIDPQWSQTAVRLIRKCAAPVTPIYFSGSNSTKFQLAGLIHPIFRTALLPRELANKRRHIITARVGTPITTEQIQATDNDVSLSNLLRLRTYALDHSQHTNFSKRPLSEKPKQVIPVADQINPQYVIAELNNLPSAQQLLETNGLKVVYGQARQLPWTLQELGRLREITFRNVGEGTGKERDIDLYDNYYTHLICWNPSTGDIVGAYRIGVVDQVLNHFGVRGLYTHTLFKLDKKLFQQDEMAQGKALELGRSFVREEYQRSYTPLLALWRGICCYVSNHPEYRILFGPVSISNDYLPTSRLMLVDFLKQHHLDEKLSKYIKARNGLKRRHPLASLSKEIARENGLESFSSLLSEIEPDRKGIPVLIRQYIKFGGKLLGFNLDSQFGNVIDGLIMVDLPNTELKTLQRYMGKEEALTYINSHNN